MELIDSHCHLDDFRFDADLEQVIERALAAGVNCLIAPSARADGWQKLAALAAASRAICPAFGVHPWYCQEHDAEVLARLPAYLDHAVAVGECGLDFGKGRAPESEQLYWFRRQLELAVDKNLPVIVHAYKALDRVISELRNFPGLRGVVHSFSGSQQQADALMERDFYLGIGGAITRTNALKLRNMVKQIPLEYLLLETDAPDQPTLAHRGERNEPAFLIEIAAEIATMRGMELSELTDICNHNARELFAL